MILTMKGITTDQSRYFLCFACQNADNLSGYNFLWPLQKLRNRHFCPIPFCSVKQSRDVTRPPLKYIDVVAILRHASITLDNRVTSFQAPGRPVVSATSLLQQTLAQLCIDLEVCDVMT